MRMTERLPRRPKRHGGAMLVLIAVVVVVFLIMAVMSVDVAYMQLVRTELRASADASCRYDRGCDDHRGAEFDEERDEDARSRDEADPQGEKLALRDEAPHRDGSAWDRA